MTNDIYPVSATVRYRAKKHFSTSKNDYYAVVREEKRWVSVATGSPLEFHNHERARDEAKHMAENARKDAEPTSDDLLDSIAACITQALTQKGDYLDALGLALEQVMEIRSGRFG